MKGRTSKKRAEDGSRARTVATDRCAPSTTRKKFDLNDRLVDPRLQKALLRLHAAMETEEVITAIFGLVDAVAPSRYIGVWFQVLEPDYKYPRILRFKGPAFSMSPEQFKRS